VVDDANADDVIEIGVGRELIAGDLHDSYPGTRKGIKFLSRDLQPPPKAPQQ
jgi:hypothetical protein